jgi:hypothetical protein
MRNIAGRAHLSKSVRAKWFCWLITHESLEIVLGWTL